MFLTEEQQRVRRGLLRTPRDVESEQRLREELSRRKKKIEHKFVHFVPNHIYIFPRN